MYSYYEQIVLRAKTMNMDPGEFLLLVSHVLKKTIEKILSSHTHHMTARQYTTTINMMRKRSKHYPMAYLIGTQPFHNITIRVDTRVLIPRPTTEELAQLVADYADNTKNTIVDIGTGSGCIAVYLATALHNAKLLATDTSLSSLTVARYNAKKNKARVRFFCGSLLQPLQKRKICPDIIVANLPYLPAREIQYATRHGVAVSPQEWQNIKHEPHRALIGGTRGDELIRECLTQTATLTPLPRALFFEADPSQLPDLKTFVQTLFPKYKVKIIKDLSGHRRFLTITKAP